ncbi:MAG: hypothetical protein OEL20_06850 [Sulfuritalea sp.]|nr:hypothetical protein [Sulfuritalea sp.]
MPSELESKDAAIAENVQHTVEQVALRKVRKLSEQLEKEQADKDRLERRVLIFAAIIGLVFVAWVALVLFGSGPTVRQQPPQSISLRSTSSPARSADNSAPAASSIKISILESGDYLIGRRTSANSEDTSKPSKAESQTPADLKKAIAEASEGDKELQVDIAADRNSKFQSYVTLLQALEELQLYRVSILTAKQPNPSINADAAR